MYLNTTEILYNPLVENLKYSIVIIIVPTIITILTSFIKLIIDIVKKAAPEKNILIIPSIQTNYNVNKYYKYLLELILKCDNGKIYNECTVNKSINNVSNFIIKNGYTSNFNYNKMQIKFVMINNKNTVDTPKNLVFKNCNLPKKFKLSIDSQSLILYFKNYSELLLFKTENGKDYNLYLTSREKLIDFYTTYKDGRYVHLDDNGIAFNCVKTFDNCIYNKNIADRIKQIIDSWNKDKDRYYKLGIPHKLCMCFYGSPGTGKTSLCHCIKNYTNRKIYYITVTSFTSTLNMHKLRAIPKRSIIVFEDFDIELKTYINKVSLKKKDIPKEEHAGIVLKNLMTFLDAYMTSKHNIILFTINDIDSIPNVLIRPGRIDHLIKIDIADEYQLEQLAMLYEKKYNDIIETEEFKLQANNITSAQFITNFLMN